MGRLWQLRQTLPQNLSAFEGRIDVEFVLLDYNSQDGLEDWLQHEAFVRKAIERGLLVYGKERSARYYHSSKAKNLAHRIATGDVLFNLDADNLADADLAIRSSFETTTQVIFHSFRGGSASTCGRVGISREWFFRLGGYDESFEPAVYQDVDLVNRATAAGLALKMWSTSQTPISNSGWDKVKLTGSTKTLAEMQILNQDRSRRNIATGQLVANSRGWGGGTLSINFHRPIKLRPVVPRIPIRYGETAIPLSEDGIVRLPPVNECVPGWASGAIREQMSPSLIVARERSIYTRFG